MLKHAEELNSQEGGAWGLPWSISINGSASDWYLLSAFVYLRIQRNKFHLDCRSQNVVIIDYHGSYIIIIRAIVNYKHFMMTLERFYYGVYQFNFLLNLMHLNAAAAAKSLQSCPTLCDPIDGSPPGSAVPGILQARTLEWVAISLSNAWKWKVKVKSLSRVQILATPWTAAYQPPPSVGFSRQEYWSGVPLPSPMHLNKQAQRKNNNNTEKSEAKP